VCDDCIGIFAQRAFPNKERKGCVDCLEREKRKEKLWQVQTAQKFFPDKEK
jgi:hypothetical protein